MNPAIDDLITLLQTIDFQKYTPAEIQQINSAAKTFNTNLDNKVFEDNLLKERNK